MRLRRNALAVATVAAISFTAVAPAQAEASAFVVAQAGGSSVEEDNGDATGSWGNVFPEYDVFKQLDGGQQFLTIVKGTLVVVAFATALSVGLGFLRTLIYNVAGV
ncbi:hypothetical protein [Corynebacterium suicordis]|uniref:Secreted protein n=1 Tax=Corynebacterium suicordis DSM 45110 TaxID=1121369 RepID=A0ABR9ZJN7_9CORY|nr:hypothetical protein [Corynebacterium suicordis]MBF4553641.1 hypothetical protein [Corynebacterium suicordis DSM 45110]MDR6277385.1 hypothetical protein [Corynebacterium suicordis]